MASAMVGEPPRASSAPTRPARLVPRVAAERIAADVRTWAEGGGLGGHHASDCAPDTSVATFTPRSSPFDQK